MPRRCAFTIVELLIVLLVMGILAGVAAPKFGDALADLRVASAAKRIAADLRYAKSEAIRTATTITVSFDADAATYALTGASDPDRPGKAYEVSPADEGYQVAFDAADFDGGAAVSFDHRGHGSAAGEVTVSAGGYSRTVSVLLPGQITITE